MSKWYYSRTRFPKGNTIIEFIGYENDYDSTVKLNFICKININLQAQIIYIKKHSIYDNTTDFKGYEDILSDKFIGDRWRYLDNNELMAYL